MTNYGSLERMIADQVGLWSMQERVGSAQRKVHYPVISLSREFGTRAAELARKIGVRTGFTVWDRELVHAIAEEAGADERIMGTLDENRRNQVDEAVRSFIMGSSHSNVSYFKSLMRTVRTIAQHGSAIVVGRGANFAISPKKVLRVRLTAPLEWRSEQLASRRDDTVKAMRQEAVTKDAERADFVSYYFKKDIDEPAQYDLIVNAERYSLDQMVDIVLYAYREAFGSLPNPDTSAQKREVAHL